MAQQNHDWLVTGPWYSVDTLTKDTPPLIQKYDTPQLVNRFLRDPQDYLAFEGEDTVSRTVPQAPGSGKFENLVDTFNAIITDLKHLSDPHKEAEVKEAFAKSGKAFQVIKTGVRKLFLDTHRRFYLIVCEVFCNAPGLPRVSRSEICRAGFVIRRITKAPSPLVQGWFPLEMQPAAGPDAGPKPPRSSKSEQIGAWRPLDSTAEQPAADLNGERFYPLYPLIPDPRDTEHAGAGRAIYFALIPTGSDEKSDDGAPRFDSADTAQENFYHIRCFVQRYKPGCPRKRGAPCHGAISWSRPSEEYQLANHFDLEGTSHNPVSIQIPNLTDIMAQVAADPARAFDKLASVRLSGGPGSPEFTADNKGDPKGSRISNIPTICFNSIPLITLVALFAFAIFLPIVLFLFNAYWMLLLRFCIPPKLGDLLGGLLNISGAGDLFAKALGLPLDKKPSFDLSKLVKLARRRARRKR